MRCVRYGDRIQLVHALVPRLWIPDSDCNRAGSCCFQLNQVFCDHKCVPRFVLNSCHRLHLDCYKPCVHCFGTIFPCRWNFIRQQHTLAELALLASVFPVPSVFRYLFKPIPELFWRGKEEQFERQVLLLLKLNLSGLLTWTRVTTFSSPW